MQAYFCICLMHSKAPHISAIGACFLFESILRIATRQSYYVDAIVRGARMSKITFETAVAQHAEATRLSLLISQLIPRRRCISAFDPD